MFGVNKSFQMTARTCGKTVSAVLVIGLSILSFSIGLKAADEKSKAISKPSVKQKVVSDVRLEGFQAEIISGITKVSWKTDFEQNILGFKVWREDRGERILVNNQMTAGSLLKGANGVLSAGSEYNVYDRNDSLNSFYYLEAIDISGKSRWFGPFFPQTGFAEPDAADNAEMFSKLETPNGQRQQIDSVDFLTPELRKVEVSEVHLAGNGLLANDPNALKIEVSTRGMYRVDAQTLVANGFNPAQSATWRLFTGGVEQPMNVAADGSVEFFGRPISTIQTDANVYWLVTDAGSGLRFSRTVQNYLSSAAYGWTRVTAERKDRIYRVDSILNGARENWYGDVVHGTPFDQTLNLNDIATDSRQTATVGIDLQGLTTVSHQVSVLLNGVSLGQINFYLYNRTEWMVTIPLSRLVEGTNTITLQALGGSSDVNIIEAVRISYPRRLKAQNNRLDFSVSAKTSVKLKGFTSQRIRLFDVTNPLRVIESAPDSRLESDGTYSATVASATSARVMFAQVETASLLTASSLNKNNASNLKTAQHQAKFVVIAPREFIPPLTAFADSHRSQGIQTEVVDVEDIYDEFNNGVKSAESIKAFLQYAKQYWTVKPDFALFVGDASNDPKNYTGLAGNNANRVPTMLTDTWNMETVSDELMADFDGDVVGEIAVGRLPAKDLGELQAMLDKINAAVPMTAQEIAGRGVHFVSDGFVGYDFAAGSRNVSSVMPAGTNVNFLDRASQDPTAVRADIINRINSGAAIVNYFGHASLGAWTSSQILRNVDAQSLNNPNQTPLMTMVACLNGDFAEAEITGIAEAMMKRRFGGANAVWASSGWDSADTQEHFVKDFYQKVFTGMPLGEAARQSKMLYPDTDLRKTYIFFGDPTQKLVRP